MFFHSLPPPAPVSGGADGLLARVLGALVWLMLAALGAVFALSLLIWLVVMVVVSLVGSLFTGRPATVTLLWRRYRDMTREVTRSRWSPSPASSTPRADAAQATGAASAQTSVQDVSWREVPAAPAADGDAPGR
ncbi:MAG: hypothetical protein IT498_04530 [Rubrivivax sp.]|uniref:hypothetical protein n=1 Tax=Ottowia sp. TaxID=1898956 RepID=UPI00217B0D6D|nr:hypothetical protein [Ottowia sp.]MCC6813290.1 hypothetical protein [Rubrivivax sp.]HNI85119.1 hypothetical protein [Ottowia sp.]HNR82578.1 hypothetical protein [Ottowia sp.]